MLLKNKRNIIAWLDEYEVENYKLIPDTQYGFVVDVEGNVELSNKKLTQIGVKFNHVSDSFYCLYNLLTSLEGCPTSVNGYFLSNQNELTSLKYCPALVGGNFACSNNHIATLDYLPTEVGGSFYCNNNPKLGKYQDITNFIELKGNIVSDREEALLSASLYSPKKTILNKV